MWEQTNFAGELHAMLQSVTDRSLRTCNRQQAHRHITIRDAQPLEWRQRLREMCRAYGLQERSLPGPRADLSLPVVPNLLPPVSSRRRC